MLWSESSQADEMELQRLPQNANSHLLAGPLGCWMSFGARSGPKILAQRRRRSDPDAWAPTNLPTLHRESLIGVTQSFSRLLS